MEFLNIGPDAEGIISFETDGQEKRYHNPFLVALQAMMGDCVFEDYKQQHSYLVPRYVSLKWLLEDTVDKRKEIAMEWLMSHFCTDGDCAYWTYDYPLKYQDRKLSVGWHSAYAQAYVVFAMLFFYCKTNDKRYSNMACMAANGLIKEIGEGGCAHRINDDELWFEEIPEGECTYIYNAHLVSLLALYEIKERLHRTEYDRAIEAGEKAFLRLLPGMNTGTKSAYAFQDKIDVTLLLDVDAAYGTSVYIGDFAISNGEKCARIDLSNQKCFEKSPAYASGIDWSSDVDENGLRRVVLGRYVREKAVSDGAIHNTFINISDFPIREDVCRITFKYSVSSETEIRLKKNTERGFVPLGGGCAFKLPAGRGEKTVSIPSVSFFNDISDPYHKYHIELLNDLSAHLDHPELKLLLDDLRVYSMEDNPMNVEPRLQFLSVVVNTECGLHCKMCDIGSDNKEASIYSFLKGDNKGGRLDFDLLIKRVKEGPSTLELIHIVGTEPTLHPQLPDLIRELKMLGKKVLVTTNGINIKNMLIPVLESGADSVLISIDGPADVHDDIRGRKGLFEDIFSFLSAKTKELVKFRENDQKIVVCCAITPMNYLSIGRLLEEIPADIIKDVWCTHMNYVSVETAEWHNRCYPEYRVGPSCIHPEMTPTLINPWLMEKHMHHARATARQLEINFLEAPVVKRCYDYEMLYHHEEITVGRQFCMAPFSTIQINADGSTCVMSRCYSIMAGNIKEKSLDDIFYGAGYIELRKRMKNGAVYGPCKRCCAIM